MGILIIIILSAGTLLVALAGIGAKLAKMREKEEQIYREELRKRAEELKNAGIITSKYDFYVGAKFGREF